MTPKPVTQTDISIRARLLNIAKKENRDFNAILNLYYQERLLARLAASHYRERFLLKGGLCSMLLPHQAHVPLGVRRRMSTCVLMACEMTPKRCAPFLPR